jgi:hypothetical protein
MWRGNNESVLMLGFPVDRLDKKELVAVFVDEVIHERPRGAGQRCAVNLRQALSRACRGVADRLVERLGQLLRAERLQNVPLKRRFVEEEADSFCFWAYCSHMRARDHPPPKGFAESFS